MVRNLFLATDADPHWALVCLLGIGVVFVGLVLIIGLVELMNFATNRFGKKAVKSEAKPAQAVASAPATTVIENRDELVAAVCAAIAEENGTDISAIRVVSFKKIS
ncbi:MAG: OadG family protein [Clostridia bacterium]|nr:OadG family protein [Clostridia bacterium]